MKHKRVVLFVPLVFILLAILIVPPFKLVHFKSSFLFLFKSPLSYSYRAYVGIFNISRVLTVYSEHSRLKEEVARLRYETNQMEELRIENQRLQAILEVKEKGEFQFIASRVIGKEPTNWLNSLIIDKGEQVGISINMPVMSFNGLIGKVVETGKNYAKVLLISDVNSRVVVILQRTRQEGMLEGIGQGLCRMKYLPLESDVELGDAVVSSGIGGVYPKGLVVGKIESIKVERGGLYKSCIIKPAAPLNGIEEVLCIKSDLRPEDSL